MARRLLLSLALLPLAACGLISAPMEALEGSLQRDDKVHARYGKDLNLVNVGDSRASVHSAWGSPRRTFPEYPEFDLYLVAKNSDQDIRVLPGDYNNLSRTSLYVMQVSYREEVVSDIRINRRLYRGSRRDFCDDDGWCAKMFTRHSVPGNDVITNPLVVAASEPGIAIESMVRRGACEIVVFPADSDSYWLNALVYAEVRYNQRPIGVFTADAFLRFQERPGDGTLQASKETRSGGGQLKVSDDAAFEFQCEAGGRTYISVGSTKTGFWAVNRGTHIAEVSESEALQRLSGLKEIRLPSAAHEATASQ